MKTFSTTPGSKTARWVGAGTEVANPFGVAVMLLALLVALASPAATLVITRDGASLWATAVNDDGDTVSLVTQQEGTEKRVPKADVAFVLPAAEPGKTYPPDEMEANIRLIQQAQAEFPKLAKQTVLLLNAWRALQAGGAGLADELAALLKKSATATDIKVYRDVSGQLQMLRYRDMQGTHWKQIDTELEKMKAAYVQASLPRLQELAATQTTSFGHFRAVHQAASDLCSVQPPDDVRKTATDILEKQRAATLQANLAEAVKVFSASRSVDAYLQARDILTQLREDVAATPESQTSLEQQIEKLTGSAAKAQSALSFEYKGYPLSRPDQELLRRMERAASLVDFAGMRVNEQCLVVPTQMPNAVPRGGTVTQTLRLIFNRAQPPDRKYIIAAMVPGENNALEWLWDCPAFTVTAGRAEVSITGELKDFPADFAFRGDSDTPERKGKKRSHVAYLWLAMPDPEASPQNTEPGARWLGLSLAWRLPLQ